MKSLPPDVNFQRRTPVFTNETVPPALLKNHKTNMWGRIQVEKGTLEYYIGENEKHILKPGKPGIIEPQMLHHIRPLDLVSFFIEFYK